MKMPILYSFRRCPYAMRARLAIAYSQVNVVLREVVLKNKPAAMLKASAKGTVPVLCLADGCIIDESLDIMKWALTQNEQAQWPLEDEQQLALIAHCDDVFKGWLDKYKYADRHPEHSMDYYREHCCEFLAVLEQQLAGSDYLFSEQMSLADAAIFPFVRQFAHVDRQWFYQSEFINVQRWLNLQLDSSLFQAIMFKYKPWQEEDEEVLFTH
ncbi:glutathione S-transferase [Gammaproteobacteria bacterium AS21]